MPLFDRGAKRSPAPSSPSTMIFVLAAMTSAYLGLAVYFAVEHALLTAGPETWIAAAIGLLLLALASQLEWDNGVVLVMAVGFMAQLAWAGWVDPQPLSDFDAFWGGTIAVADAMRGGDWGAAMGEIHQSPQPSATFVYGLAVFAFGEDLATIRALTAGVWALQTWLIWRVASEVSELRSRAFACAFVFGLSPTMVIFGGLPSVEALYGLFALGALYMMLSHRRRGLGLSALYAGALGALAFLALPSGVAYLVGLVAVLAIGFASALDWRQRGRMAGAIGLCLLGFGLAAAPQAALNYRFEGSISIAPGPAIGQQLLAGTDRGGAPTPELVSTPLATTAAADLTLREKDLLWREVAYDRIAADPVGFLGFALTEKMRLLWASEEQMLSWAYNAPSAEQSPLLDSAAGRLTPHVVAGAYMAMIIAAAAGALRMVLRWGAVRDPTRWVLFHAAFLALALTYVFAEVGGRKHLAFAPLLALLAPLPFARLPRVKGFAPPAEETDAPARAADAAPAAAPPPSLEKPPSEWTVQEKLAHRLRSMSKPPRQEEDEEEAETAASARSDRQERGPAA